MPNKRNEPILVELQIKKGTHQAAESPRRPEVERRRARLQDRLSDLGKGLQPGSSDNNDNNNVSCHLSHKSGPVDLRLEEGFRNGTDLCAGRSAMSVPTAN